ncbi:hypothetical protein GEOBC_01075 [Geobacteraceae bacterium]|nr:hypothetical protein GEOBC_01075 [Geobacteraceae bacterium]
MAPPPDPHNKGRLFVSPDAPAGGGGPGYFRQSTSTMSCHAHTAVPAHGSPAARRMTPQDHQRADTLRRAKCVYDALFKAQSWVGPAIKEETGCALDEALSGILPGVVLMVGGLAASAALGGAVGALIGSFAGGVGAIPGAAAGAAAGAELGMLLLNALGIGFLAVYIAQHITKVFDLATQGVKEAWNAPSSAISTSTKVNNASRTLARAVAVFIRLVLEGIVLYLLEKGAAITAQRVSDVGAKLRASKLGVRLAEYVERNWKALVENPKLNSRGKDFGGGNRSKKADSGHKHDTALASTTKAETQAAGIDARIRKVRTAEAVNAKMKEMGDDPAWMPGTQVVNRDALPGERYNMVLDSDQAAKLMDNDMRGLGGWGSQDTIATQSVARNKLAITDNYKKDVSFIAEIEVVKTMPLEEGIAGPQGILKGEGHQVHFEILPQQRSEYLRVNTIKSLPPR